MIKNSSIHLICVVLVLFCGFGAGQTPIGSNVEYAGKFENSRAEKLFAAVERLTKVYKERDELKIADLFVPNDVESVGGRERFAELVGLLGTTSRETVVKFNAPETIDQVDRKWFGIVPFRIEWVENKTLRVVETCLVGISHDDGKTWSFKTGESFYKAYPELIGKIRIIERNTTETVVE